MSSYYEAILRKKNYMICLKNNSYFHSIFIVCSALNEKKSDKKIQAFTNFPKIAYFEVNQNKSSVFIILALEPRGKLATENYCL